jgi:glycosyltransferase involved in cell wall biosynthesis
LNTNKIPKISIITPCFNAEKYILETVTSVINQSAILNNRATLEYIICDGGSTDKTVDIIKNINHPCITIISEPDKGMYDALSKGLAKASGDIIAYINAGDFYYNKAFDVVVRLFANKNIHWLKGLDVHFNENSEIIQVKLPFRYKKSFILSGEYGEALPYIQQESVFWRRELTNTIDSNKLSSFKLAGDYYMWHCFSKNNYTLNIVESFLGGFKVHDQQLSSALDKYKSEKKSITKYSVLNTILSYFEKILWALPPKFKKLLNKSLYRFNIINSTWE